MFIRGRKPTPNLSSATHNIAWDGNSLVFDDAETTGENQYLARRLADMGKIKQAGVQSRGVGIGSQTWATMRANITDVNALFESEKHNTLYVLEGTNTIREGRTARQAADDAGLYASAVKAVNPSWVIVVLTAIPFRTDFNNVLSQAKFDAVLAYNEILKNEYQSLGFNRVVEIGGVNSPLYVPTFTNESFQKLDPYISVLGINETLNGNGWYLHYDKTGYDVIANYVYYDYIANTN